MLTKLENEWERVYLQTNWKLETCTKPKVSGIAVFSDAPTQVHQEVSADADESCSMNAHNQQELPTTETNTDTCPPQHSQATTMHALSPNLNKSSGSSSFLVSSQIAPPPDLV